MIVVDSPAALSAVTANERVVATDNPLLADWLQQSSSLTVENLDRRLDVEDANRFGYCGIKISSDVEALVDRPVIAQRLQLERGHIRIAPNVAGLTCALIYRAAALARGVDAHAPVSITIAGLDRSPADELPDFRIERFQSPFPRLARLGFFGTRPVNVIPVETATPSVYNDTASRSLLRRIASAPFPVIFAHAALQAKLGTVIARLTGRGVIICGDNNTIREALPHLLLRGVGAIRLAAGPPPMSAEEQIRAFRDVRALIAPSVSDAIAARLQALGEFDPAQTAAIAGLMTDHIAGGLVRLSNRTQAAARALIAAARMTTRSKAILVNGANGGDGGQLHGLARRKDIPVLDFEHGVTTGLSRHSEAKIEFSEATNCDGLFVCTDVARASFARAERACGKIEVIGLADETRTIKRRRLLRIAARHSLKVMSSRPVVMHVCTTPFLGNNRSGPYAYTESSIFELNRRLIRETYIPLSGWTVVFKDYPTQRFPFEPSCAVYAGTAPHLIYAPNEDFRYLRAAADVIVTTMPTSTLGWCIGAGVPLIWLDSPVTPLLDDEQSASFRAAFIVIDMRADDWTDQLRRTLDRGLPALRQEWEQKYAERVAVSRRYIIGPSRSTGAAAARGVMQWLQSP